MELLTILATGAVAIAASAVTSFLTHRFSMSRQREEQEQGNAWRRYEEMKAVYEQALDLLNPGLAAGPDAEIAEIRRAWILRSNKVSALLALHGAPGSVAQAARLYLAVAHKLFEGEFTLSRGVVGSSYMSPPGLNDMEVDFLEACRVHLETIRPK